jgi:integrase/recombinase XerD
MLSPNLLIELRNHYRRLRCKPETWLFPGGKWHTAAHPIDTKVVWYACREAAERANIQKPLHPHTLRHYAGLRTIPGEASWGPLGGGLTNIFPA